MCTWGSIQLLPASTKLLLELKLIQTAGVKAHSTPSCNVSIALGIKPQAICKNKPNVIYQLGDRTNML